MPDYNDELRRIISQLLLDADFVNRDVAKKAKYTKAKLNDILKASKPIPFSTADAHDKVDFHTLKVCLFRLCRAAKLDVPSLCEKMHVNQQHASEWYDSVRPFVEDEEDGKAD